MSNPVCFLHNPPTRGARVRVACACGVCVWRVRWAVGVWRVWCAVGSVWCAAHSADRCTYHPLRPASQTAPTKPPTPSHSADPANQTTHQHPDFRPIPQTPPTKPPTLRQPIRTPARAHTRQRTALRMHIPTNHRTTNTHHIPHAKTAAAHSAQPPPTAHTAHPRASSYARFASAHSLKRRMPSTI